MGSIIQEYVTRRTRQSKPTDPVVMSTLGLFEAHVLYFAVRMTASQVMQAAWGVGSYNEFNPHRVARLVKDIEAYVGGDANVERYVEFDFCREGSMSVYVTFHLPQPMKSERAGLDAFMQEQAELAHVDEFDKTKDYGYEVAYRLWWD